MPQVATAKAVSGGEEEEEEQEEVEVEVENDDDDDNDDGSMLLEFGPAAVQRRRDASSSDNARREDMASVVR